MEDFYNENSYFTDYDDFNYTHYDYRDAIFYVDPHMYVITCIIISIGLPLTLVAIYFLYSQVKNDNVAPIYIINLLVSDIIQFCTMIVEVAEPHWFISVISSNIYLFGVLASVAFMVCIVLERYLLIAWPLWYRNKRTIKISLVVCVVVWTLPLVVVLPVYFNVEFVVIRSIFTIFLLVPFPLFIFFLRGTLKALSAATSVPSDEKRRIVRMLVLVLLIYTLLFLPFILLLLPLDFSSFSVILMLLKFSPLADLILYFFIRSSGFISRKDNNMYTVCSMQAVKEGEKKGRRQIEKCMQLKREETTVTVLYQYYFQ